MKLLRINDEVGLKMPEVFCIDTRKIDKKVLEEFKRHISAERRGKAEKLRKKENYACCIIAEILVRSYLIEHFNYKNENIMFSKNAWGKPEVVGVYSPGFNISHTEYRVVCAWDKAEIGVDIEVIREAPAENVIDFFHPAEQRFLMNSHDRGAFTKIWTLKESYTKYKGMGLYLPMNEFNVYKSDDENGSWRVAGDERVYLWQKEIENESVISVCSDTGNSVSVQVINQEKLLNIFSRR